MPVVADRHMSKNMVSSAGRLSTLLHSHIKIECKKLLLKDSEGIGD